MKETNKKIIVAFCLTLGLITLFFVIKSLSPDYFKEIGFNMALPWFTFIIAVIDGFNPCTLWVLSFLMVLLISSFEGDNKESRKRMLIVGFTFASVVAIIYFLFMAAWLNIFKFIGFIDPLRIGIACLAIFAGLINCKEYFAFRKGVTLMIQEQHKPFILRKIEQVKAVVKHGSTFALITASAVLAAFASLVELPCTAGWPMIYTAVLSSKVFEGGISYYLYLLFYDLIYIIPLCSMILLFAWFSKGKKITKEQTQIIKLIGGLLMIALGIVLLVNPELLMLM
jgi:cytochrome c biogenesis protein CcdA